MTETRPEGLTAYIAVTAAYWAFMLTDGALRMLVLLHFHELGFSPITLAWLFLLYEIAGIVTNLSAGWLAARFGLTTTLYAGLTLQIVALARALPARSDLGDGAVGALRDGGAGAVGRGEGSRQDVVEIGGKAAGTRGRRRAVSLGRRAHRIEERGEGRRLLPRRGAAWPDRVQGQRDRDGGDPRRDPRRRWCCSCRPACRKAPSRPNSPMSSPPTPG